MHWWNGAGHMGWMGLWWLLGVATIALVVWAILRSSQGPMSGSKETPEQILKRRYAKGEIDHPTFERMLKDLET